MALEDQPSPGDAATPHGPRGELPTAELSAELTRLLEELAPIGRARGGGYTRLAYTPVEADLRAWFAAQADARGLGVEEDRAGNLWAWWGGPPTPGAGPAAVATGSHLDSVTRGGAYDGPLGVLSAFLAVDVLRRRGLTPARPLAIVAFADEEGARFGVACTGSKVLAGLLAPERALALRDDDGVSLGEAWTASGRDPRTLAAEPSRLDGLAAFVELHVEQGRGLADLGAPVAVGSAIRPHGRWRFDLAGRADHAGTTRLEDRDDPMLTHARVVLSARQAAARCGAVATVARVVVDPGSVNAIPSRVATWLDARADDEAVVRAVVDEVAAVAGVTPTEESWAPRVDLDAALRERAAALVARRHGAAPVLATGAGHDAGILAAAGVPAAMLFVRNPTGVSHTPEEHAEPGDAAAGVAALADVLEELTGR